MQERIGASHVNVIPQFVAHASTDKYFINNLSLPPADALKLHNAYYTQYGLALEGLVRNHKIDPLEYNALVDDALALEDIIHPDPRLRKLLQDFDRDKVRLWLFTNAYINHGKRVVKLLGVDDLFDGGSPATLPPARLSSTL
jgi:pyrimidine and pyridine-specific 5'-nucleotidase